MKQCNENEDEQRITQLSDGTVESLKMKKPPTGGYTEEWKSHIKCSLHFFSFVRIALPLSYKVILKFKISINSPLVKNLEYWCSCFVFVITRSQLKYTSMIFLFNTFRTWITQSIFCYWSSFVVCLASINN